MHRGSKGIKHAKEDSNNSSPQILVRHTNHASMYTQQAGIPKSYKYTPVFNVSYSEGSLRLPSSRQHSLLTVQYSTDLVNYSPQKLLQSGLLKSNGDIISMVPSLPLIRRTVFTVSCLSLIPKVTQVLHA